jgi:hypothetical protein
MPDRSQLGDWVERYERAWRTPGTDAAAELFSAGALYFPSPIKEPLRGLEAIQPFWDRERTSPDEPFEMDWEIVAWEGRTGVVRAEVRYGEPTGVSWRDLWIVELDDDGRCTRFEEWPFELK